MSGHWNESSIRSYNRNMSSNQKQPSNILSTLSSSTPSNSLPSTITGSVEQTPMEQSHQAHDHTYNDVELAIPSAVNPNNLEKSGGVTNTPPISHFNLPIAQENKDFNLNQLQAPSGLLCQSACVIVLISPIFESTEYFCFIFYRTRFL